MPATLTPLRYPGGKSKYMDLFLEVLSRNNLNDCTFVEVFAGGAGAAVKLLLGGHVKALFLNDLDDAIYSFWSVVKEQPGDLISLIKRRRVNMTEWRRQKAVYEAKDTKDPLALAFATFYLNRCNHSGILGARPIGGMTQGGAYRIDSRYNKATSIAKIEALSKHSDDIEVFNMDGVSFINHLNQKHRNRKLLVYFDPPYYQKGPALYLNHFTHEDHEILRDCIAQCPFSWVLSYDDSQDIVDLYKDQACALYRNQIRHTITGNEIANELIISRLQMPEYLMQL